MGNEYKGFKGTSTKLSIPYPPRKGYNNVMWEPPEWHPPKLHNSRPEIQEESPHAKKKNLSLFG